MGGEGREARPLPGDTSMRTRLAAVRSSSDARAPLDVLVAQADSLGAVAVIRSLGRAGHRVHAVSTDPGALGLWSRYAHRTAVSPDYADPRYVAWVRDYVRTQRISAIIPSESFLLALGAARAELLPLVPFAPDERTLLDAMSKYALLENLLGRGAPHLPPTLLVPDLRSPPSTDALRDLGAPLFVKVDACAALDGSPGATHCAASADEALAILLRVRHAYARAVVQGFVPGRGVGAFFLRARGEVVAEFMHHRLHEVPYTGGVSSLRESWFHARIRDDALEKLGASGWEGVAMMEYRWDAATDRFAFVEMNARFWGSLHLALHAGVDFPRLLLDAWQGRAVTPPRPRPGVRCRHLPDEVRHVWSKLRSPALGPGAKLAAVAGFLALGADPRVRGDLWFPGDRGLFWRGLARLPSGLPRAVTSPKLAAYRIARALGAFRAARWLTRRKLRIVAYHGIELHDESRFSPTVFIRPETFAQRLERLRREYPVLPLGEAVRRLQDGTLPPCAVAITIDDGFHSTAAVAAPLLHAARLPATLYVTTYYVQRDAPVFRLAMQYAFWKTRVTALDLAAVVAGAAGVRSLGTEDERDAVLWELVNHGERHLDQPGRTALLRATAAQLGVDLDPVLRDRALHLMTPDEVRTAATTLDVQLHTHRHRFPDDPLLARAEIEENRRVLEPLAANPLVHLCYPSGFWSESLFPVLAAAGIETATTCDGGLNGPDVHRYALRRFFDGEHVSALEFEAELSGTAELLRTVLRWFGRRGGRLQIDAADRRRGFPAGHGRTLLERGTPATVPA